MRYLIYKTTGGMYHMLMQINNAVNLAKETERKLIIDCSGSVASCDFNDYFTVYGFEYTTSLEEVSHIYNYNKSAYHVDGKYMIDDAVLTMKREEVLSCKNDYLFFSYLDGYMYPDWNIRANEEMMNFVRPYSINGEYIGVHFRNTDYVNDITLLIDKVNKEKAILVYLATDDQSAYDIFVDKCPDKKILQFTKPINCRQGVGIHYTMNPDESMHNSILDSWMLINAQEFHGCNNSSFTRMVHRFRTNNKMYL